MRIRDNKGSITIFVLVALIFMTMFLIVSYGSNINRGKTASEQFNIISGIYSYGDGDEAAYNRIYTALRKKNTQTLTYDSGVTSGISTVTLEKTMEEIVSNYQIYGSMSKNIEITVTNGTESKKYTIELSQALNDDEYIDYRTKKVFDLEGTEKYSVSLPDIYLYEDNTTITVTDGGTPSRIILEYIGYKFYS